MLKWIKDTYNDPEIFITEMGVADDGTSLDDDQRICYYKVSIMHTTRLCFSRCGIVELPFAD